MESIVQVVLKYGASRPDEPCSTLVTAEGGNVRTSATRTWREVADGAGRVVLETRIGGRRLVDFPRGLLLPRIC